MKRKPCAGAMTADIARPTSATAVEGSGRYFSGIATVVSRSSSTPTTTARTRYRVRADFTADLSSSARVLGRAPVRVFGEPREVPVVGGVLGVAVVDDLGSRDDGVERQVARSVRLGGRRRRLRIGLPAQFDTDLAEPQRDYERGEDWPLHGVPVAEQV